MPETKPRERFQVRAFLKRYAPWGPLVMAFLGGAAMDLLRDVRSAVVDRVVPDDPAEKAKPWLETADAYLSQHYLWVMAASLFVGTLYAYWLVKREMKFRGTWADEPRALNEDPARRVWAGIPYPVMDTANNRIGFCIPIHNGNAYPVKFGVRKPASILYGDRIVKAPQLEVEGLGEDAPALFHFWIVIFIRTDGLLGEQIRADYERGKLEQIDIRGLGLVVVDGSRVGPLRSAPDGVLMSKKDNWTLEVPVFDFERRQ